MQSFKEYFYKVFLEANSEKRIEFLIQKYQNQIISWIENTDILSMLEYNDLRFVTGVDKKDINSVATALIKFTVNVVDPENGTYSEWILKRLMNGLQKTKKPTAIIPEKPDFRNKHELYMWLREDYYEVHDNLEKYHKYKKFFKTASRDMNNPETARLSDINQIYTFEDLYQSLKIIYYYIKENEDAEAIKLAEKDAEKIYNSANYLILIPKTVEASCAYGRGTRWCTAATGSSNYFNEYNKEGPLYIIINKNNQEKYQFHFQSEQYMDAEDDPIDIQEFFKNNPELKNPLIQLAHKNNNQKFEHYIVDNF